jgi:cell division protein FtsL
MEKTKKIKRRRVASLTIKEWVAIGTFAVAAISVLVGAVLYFEKKFTSIDQRFEAMDHKFEMRFDSVDRRLDKVESRLDNLEVEVKKTSRLLNNYLTWRFLYVHDPKRKNIEPRYDPNERTLEFVDKGAAKIN